jgi:ABC-type multidrug transport system ATPase subunit
MEVAERLCDWVAIVEHGRLIEIGRTEELVSWHRPERTVVLATGEPIAEERLRHPARRDGDLAKFSVHDSRAATTLSLQ